MYMERIYRKLNICSNTFKDYLKGLFIICVFLIALGSIIPAKAATVSKNGIDDRTSLYRSIKILSGDTLDSIADTYNNYNDMDNAEYISEIKKINSLTSDNIHPGCYITVVYSN